MADIAYYLKATSSEVQLGYDQTLTDPDTHDQTTLFTPSAKLDGIDVSDIPEHYAVEVNGNDTNVDNVGTKIYNSEGKVVLELVDKTIVIKDGSVFGDGDQDAAITLKNANNSDYTGSYQLDFDSSLKPTVTPPATITWIADSKTDAHFNVTLVGVYKSEKVNDKQVKVSYSTTEEGTITLKGLKSADDADKLAELLNGKAAVPAVVDETTGETTTEAQDAVPAAAVVAAGVITLDKSVLGSTEVKLSGDGDYTLAVAGSDATSDNKVDGVALDGGKVWNQGKTATAATYTKTLTGKVNDYYVEADDKTITKLTKTKLTLSYAKVSGLPKPEEAITDADEYDGLEIKSMPSGTTPGVIEVSQDLLGDREDVNVKKLSLDKNSNFKFVFNDEEVEDIVPQDAENTKWSMSYSTKTKNGESTTVGKGTWTYSIDTSAGWEIESAGKNVTYKDKKTTTFATLSGITTNLEGFSTAIDDVTDEDFEVSGATVKYKYTDDEGAEKTVDAIKITEGSGSAKGTITLNEAVFGGKKITLKSDKYELALDDDYSVKDISEDEAKWVVDKNGKAILTGGKSAGYVVKTDNKGVKYIEYTKAKVTAYATISGLFAKTNEKKELTADEIKALEKALNEATTKHADAQAAVAEVTDPETGDVITLAQAATEEEIGTITLNSDMLKYAGAKITLGSKDKYKLVLGTDADNESIASTVSNGEWKLDTKTDGTFTGGAKYYAKINAGYLLSGDGKTVTYTAEKDKSDTNHIAEITGLDKNKLTAETDLSDYLDVSGNTITLTPDESNEHVFGTKVSLKNKNGGSFVLGVADSLEPQTEEGTWDVTKGVATYYTGKTAGYVADAKGTAVSYTKPKNIAADVTKAKITNLATTATAEDINLDGKNIVLGPGALGTDTKKKATLTTGGSDGYKLVAGNGVVTSDTVVNQDGSKNKNKYWLFKSGKATYNDGVPAYYTFNQAGTEIVYTAAAKPDVLATISNLNKDVSENDLDLTSLDNKVIKLKASAFDAAKYTKTKVTLGKNDDYTLAIDYDSKNALEDGEFKTNFKAAVPADAWGTVDNKDKVLYQRTIPEDKEGYLVSDDGKSINYVTKDTKAVTLATLSGVKEAPAAPVEGVITLTSAHVNNTKITLKGDGYSLALGNGVNAPVLDSEAAWKTSSTTATLKSKITTGGYSQTDSKTIAYTAAATSEKSLASIKGVVKNVDITATTDDNGTNGTFANNKMTFSATDMTKVLSKEITADGKGFVEFDFGTYASGKVTGSTVNDKFTFGGTGLTIDTKAGDDYVKLGTADRTDKGDTFIYKSGDGDDVVVDFTTDDNLTINNAKKIEVTHDETNTYVNVDDKGAITLDTFNYSGITIGKLSSVSLMSSADLDSSTDGLQNIITVNSTSGYTNADFSADFTLSGSKAFTATISLTKKTVSDPDPNPGT